METIRDNQLKFLMKMVNCRNNFECYEKGIENFKKVKDSYNGVLLNALTDDAKYCPYAIAFGYGYFCHCPVLKYLYQNYRKK
jgi:hypothetical protein